MTTPDTSASRPTLRQPSDGSRRRRAGAVQAADRLADRLDELVPYSDELGNQVLADDARLVRWAAPVFLAVR